MDCPKCGTQVHADDVNLANLIAKCRSCHEVFTFGNLARHADTTARAELPLPAPRPPSIQVEDENGRQQLTRRWFTPIFLFLVLFCIAWDSFLVFWYTMALTGNAPWLMIVFPVVHLAVGIGMTYYTLAGLVNTTVVAIEDGQMEVRHGPLPWLGNRRLAAGDIRQLFCDESQNWNRRNSWGSPVTYNVNVVLADGQQCKLLSGLDDKGQALFYEQQLEAWLGIKPQPVRGEIK